jgi:cytochrome c oxidase cbb3-type subunit 3
MSDKHRVVHLALAAITATSAACGVDGSAATIQQDTTRQAASAPQQSAAQGAAGAMVLHADNLRPGLAAARGVTLRSPYDGNTKKIAEGAMLFVNYNCMDCHGADGSGAMGPSLQDGRWHFGGSPSEVFQSIYEGRPDGMPAWGALLSDDQIWTLVAYVRSLEKGHAVTTENFTGAGVERSGH